MLSPCAWDLEEGVLIKGMHCCAPSGRSLIQRSPREALEHQWAGNCDSPGGRGRGRPSLGGSHPGVHSLLKPEQQKGRLFPLDPCIQSFLKAWLLPTRLLRSTHRTSLRLWHQHLWRWGGPCKAACRGQILMFHFLHWGHQKIPLSFSVLTSPFLLCALSWKVLRVY